MVIIFLFRVWVKVGVILKLVKVNFMFIVINLFSKDFDKFWRLLEVDWFIVLLCVVVFIFSFFGLG